MAKQTFTSGKTLTAAQMNDLQSNDFNQTVSTKTAAYTFVVGDRGTRVVLNDTTARTFTIDDAIFSAGDTIQVHNINTGVLTIAAGAGVTLNGADVLTVAQWQSGTIYFTSASSAIFFPTAKTVSAGGLVRITGETAFTAASSVTFDSAFSSTYRNYKLIMNYTTSTTNDVSLRLRASGSSVSTNTYNFQRNVAEVSSIITTRSVDQSAFQVAILTNGAFNATSEITLYGPNIATPTIYSTIVVNNRNPYNGGSAGQGTILYQHGGNQTDSTQFTGFEILVSTGTITGTYTLYGMATA